LLGCQNLPGKKKQTNKQIMWQNSRVVSETKKKVFCNLKSPWQHI
jgi:hypothetical protein